MARHTRLRPLLPRGYHAYRFPGGRIYLDVREAPAMLARALSVYETSKVVALRRFLPPDGVFIDIGGNKGDFALIAARHLAGGGRVVCIEPEPSNVGWIKRSVARNGYRNVDVVEGALAAESGEAVLHVAARSGLHSLATNAKYRSIGEITVRTLTLDELISEHALERVDVLKIDVEGGEEGVLAGASKLLDSGCPLVILLDLHPGLADVEECCRTLVAAGFEVRQPSWPYGPLTVTADTAQALAIRGRPVPG